MILELKVEGGLPGERAGTPLWGWWFGAQVSVYVGDKAGLSQPGLQREARHRGC